MKKIMFYINVISHGGAERVMVNLAEVFSKDYEVIFVTSEKTENEYHLSDSIKRYVLEEDGKNRNRVVKNIYRIHKLRKLCKKESPDILLSFMAEPNYRSIIATIGLPIKTVISVRNDPKREYSGKLGRILSKYLLPLADGCVFQTDDAKSFFSDKLQKKSKIIPNAVNQAFFETEYAPISGRIVTCGRLDTQKNQKLLIDAFALIADKYSQARLEIFGIGALKDELQAQIDRLGIGDRAFLMGLTDNVQQELSRTAVFVLSSDYEGMPNALMEALAVGVPSVSTDCPCGGPRMLIKDGVNGILIKVGSSSQELADVLDYLLKNDEIALEMSRNAKEMAQDYRSEKIISVWKEYIGSVIN